jgi:hypothetical protein
VGNDAGVPVTGIPNSATEDSVPLANAAGTLLPYNPNGMDIEDIHTLPGGDTSWWRNTARRSVIVDAEWQGDAPYTPQGKTLPGASYPVSDTLPAILSQRRANRGFEAVAVSPDGTTAYTVMQSPLGRPQRERRRGIRGWCA